MALTCLNDCVFDVSILHKQPWPNYIMVSPNGFSIVLLPSVGHPNGENKILPLQPWPPRPGWPGQPPGEGGGGDNGGNGGGGTDPAIAPMHAQQRAAVPKTKK
jgi:hypothetical protein